MSLFVATNRRSNYVTSVVAISMSDVASHANPRDKMLRFRKTLRLYVSLSPSLAYYTHNNKKQQQMSNILQYNSYYYATVAAEDDVM